jgi:hypothetical protein
MIVQEMDIDLKGYTKLFRLLGKDERLFPTHVSLFSGLFIFWQRNGFKRPFQVSRSGLMAISRIASTATYQKCIKDLSSFGYIIYRPSYHPTRASSVDWPLNWQFTGSKAAGQSKAVITT